MHRIHKHFVTITFIITLSTGCLKRAIPTPPADRAEIEIPFTLTEHNNIVVAAVVNGTDTLNLMLHTAATDVRITDDAARRAKGIAFTHSDKVKSWGGESDSRFGKANRVRIGGFRRDDVEIWEDKRSGHDTDGKFGLDFFQNRVVEIDFDRRLLSRHANLPHKVETFERIKIEYRNGLLLVPGECRIDGKSYAHQFLIHTGYSGGILLDDAFAAGAGVDGKIKITDESHLKDSFGNEIKVKKGILPGFAIGRTRLSNVPAGYFAGGGGAQKMSVVGGEILTRFNLIFDVANRDLYLALRNE